MRTMIACHRVNDADVNGKPRKDVRIIDGSFLQQRETMKERGAQLETGCATIVSIIIVFDEDGGKPSWSVALRE